MIGELCVMDATGDTRTIWDPANPDEVTNARNSFEALRKKGYIAYKVIGSGDKGEIMREFDPQAGKIIMSPPVIGG